MIIYLDFLTVGIPDSGLKSKTKVITSEGGEKFCYKNVRKSQFKSVSFFLFVLIFYGANRSTEYFLQTENRA